MPRAALLLFLDRSIRSFEDRSEGPYSTDEGLPWRVVHGAKSGKFSDGGAPANHPRRCHSMNKRYRRCGRWCRRGRRYCLSHGGHTPLSRGLRDVPKYYRDKMAPRLAARLEEFLGGEDRREQLRLYEEIAVARAFACEAMELHAALLVARDRHTPGVEVEHVLSAANAVKDSLGLVADLAGRCSAIEKNLTDKVGLEQLGFFVEEIVRIVHRRLGDTEQARLLTEDLRTRARVPAEDVDPRVEVVVQYDSAA